MGFSPSQAPFSFSPSMVAKEALLADQQEHQSVGAIVVHSTNLILVATGIWQMQHLKSLP